jgi:glycosyltransferase involved in cell wall biosynthesis
LFLLNRNIDVLICCQNKDVKIGAKAAREVGIKAIFARQGIQNLSNKRKYIRPFTEYIDGIITNKNSIKKNYESFGWFPPGFIHVVYNGVNVPGTVREFDLHEKYALPPGSRVIATAGRLDHQKGFDLLIKVAQMAKVQKRNWQFIIAGQGKLKNALHAMAERLGVDDMVHLIGFSHDVYSLIKSSDVFVLPSRYEGMPNALLEAMALGKANVATAVNGAAELVIDGVTGFLVEPEETQRMFEKMDLILNNDTLRNSMGRKSKERVEKYFTNEKMVEHLERIFLDRLGRKR